MGIYKAKQHTNLKLESAKQKCLREWFEMEERKLKMKQAKKAVLKVLEKIKMTPKEATSEQRTEGLNELKIAVRSFLSLRGNCNGQYFGVYDHTRIFSLGFPQGIYCTPSFMILKLELLRLSSGYLMRPNLLLLLFSMMRKLKKLNLKVAMKLIKNHYFHILKMAFYTRFLQF